MSAASPFHPLDSPLTCDAAMPCLDCAEVSGVAVCCALQAAATSSLWAEMAALHARALPQARAEDRLPDLEANGCHSWENCWAAVDEVVKVLWLAGDPMLWEEFRQLGYRAVSTAEAKMSA